MGKKKYRLKEGIKGQVSLTTPSFECIIKEGEELELTDEQVRRMKNFIEPVPIVRKKKVEVESIEEVRTDIIVEEDK